MTSITLPIALFSLLIFDKFAFTVTQLSDSTLVSGVQFGSMNTILETYSNVNHFEEDILRPGYILYSDDNALMTTDGKTVYLVAGSIQGGYVEGRLDQARFLMLVGFLQVNSTHVLVLDSWNDCIRFVNRFTNRTSPFVGNCTNRGYRDGYYTDSQFFGPWSVIKNVNNLQTVIVSDWANRALRTIDLNNGEVRTLVRYLPDEPFGAVFSSNKEDMVIIMRHSLGRFNVRTPAYSALTSVTNKDGLDGDFGIASFKDSRSIFRVNNDLYLVADLGSSKIRIVDMKKRSIVSMCDGKSASVDGPIRNCSLRAPRSLLLTSSDTLYIGEYQRIRSIKVLRESECPSGIHVVADPKTLKAKVSLSEGHNIILSIGDHVYQKKMSGSTTCNIAVHVSDPRLKKRLDISANYQLSCTLLNDYKAIIFSVAKMRYRQIQLISSGNCKQSADNNIAITCISNVTSVLWPTDCVFQSSFVKEQEMAVTAMNDYLQKNRGTILELVIPNHTPPIIEPITNQVGLPATVLLTPFCMGGLKYLNAAQTCL